MTNPHKGSSLDSFLQKEGILENVEENAKRRVENMTELKVGDRVAIYIIDCDGNPRRIALTVFDILGDKVLFDSGTYHRKQVRKLVKVKKCDQCKGFGSYNLSKFDSVWSDGARTCLKCNGNGKVKV